MKRPHRRTHLIIWVILTPLVLIVSAMTLLTKTPEPYADLDAISDFEPD